MKDWKLALVVGGVALGGVVVGAQCFAARPAAAQTTATYSRCFVARQESQDTGSDGHFAMPGVDHMILVPSGWEVVGGGGQGGGNSGTYLGAVLLCQR
jgi:hypothetical protein